MGCTHRTVLTRVCLLVGLLGVFWFPLPVSAQTHRLDTDESPTLVALGLAVDLEVTERGDLGQRTIIGLTAKGSSNNGHAHYRCVSWSRGALVLAREEQCKVQRITTPTGDSHARIATPKKKLETLFEK